MRKNLDIEPSISCKELQYLLDGFNSQFKTSKLGKKISSQHGLGLGPLLEVIKVKIPQKKDETMWFGMTKIS